MKKTPIGLFICLGMIFGLLISAPFAFSQDEPSFSSLSLWIGGHYTGIEDYHKKVGEFDRGEEGALPEIFLDYSNYKGKKTLRFSGHFYDPKRISVDLSGRSKEVLSGKISYHSFYRQRGKDLLNNLMAREATDKLNTLPGGGKMVTSEDLTPDADFGYTRHQLTSDFKIKVPGKANLKIIASHRSILEDGEDQKIVSMHCSSCHMVSKSVEVDRQTHAASVGFEVNPVEALLLSYTGSFRTFKSEAPVPTAFYDTAEHPIKGVNLSDRVIFGGEEVDFGEIPQTQKIAHTVKLQTQMGKSKIYGSFTNSQAKNISQGLEINSNGGNLKYVVNPTLKTKFTATASLKRIENDDVEIDVPAWRGGDPEQFDFIRYSSLTRTQGEGSAEFIYQPERRYRVSVSAGYEQTTRDDYPEPEAEGKTTKLKMSLGGKYRPHSKFTGRLKYFLEKTEDPAPYNLIFEESGKTYSSPFYYYQREELRYSQVTNQATMLHGVDLKLNFKPDQKATLSAGIRASLETNSDIDTLDFERTRLQPNLSLTLSPNPRWNLFGNLSYVYDKSNGLAAVAMMNG
ncbi:MAG: hypothetical protein AMJ90_05805 [candidate division Zixibacteria bacterium SM23_73_2]|nr:MAG: hypothetical protein AMJ90_05805 [candidate division Zixibacteria bacterium SM23_73_2]